MVASAVASHPEVAAAQARVERARRARALEEARRLPDPFITTGYKRTAGFNAAEAGVTMSIPLFDRNGVAIARASGEERAAAADRAAIERRLTAEITALLDAAHLNYGRVEERIRTGFATDVYEDPDGDNCLHLVIGLQEDGELLRILAPMAYRVPAKAGPRRVAVVQRTLNQLNWESRIVQYEMDTEDGEIRLAIEERAAMSPDGLTGLEANLRFASNETMETRIFGRLSAWQNWIFNRPNAVGEKGALKVFGKGEKAVFDLNRV